jgi:cystathionine beta-lyase
MTSGQSEATKVVHSGEAPGTLPQTVGPPVQRGSTVLLPNAAALYDSRLTTYGRSGLTTQETLASALAELEGATTVRLFPSGLAAVVGSMLAVLKAGDEVLVTETIYKPTRRFCDNVLKRYGVRVTYYPARATPAELVAMASAATRLIVMESPGSLTFELQDAPGIAAAARARGILTLMDNTWAAGWFFKPLGHGIDISVQALTKYVGGHADVFMGCAATRDADIGAALDHAVWDFGWSVAPDDAYQILRGLRTLPTRLERHQDSAIQVANWLQAQPEVSRVLYPALPSSPDHALWRRDYSGAAGLFAVVFKPVPAEVTDRFLDALRLFGLGFSWGGFESLALSADPQLDVREHGSPFDGPVVRLNIGLEDPADLIADLRAGIDAMGVA